MSFRYRPLKPDEIRLLTIEPFQHGADPEALVRCKLEHISLSTQQSDIQASGSLRGGDRLWPELLAAYDTTVLFKRYSYSSKSSVNGSVNSSRGRIASSCPDQDKNETQSVWTHEWGDYICLSYVWGSKTPEASILLNGEPFTVRPNLLDALHYLRRTQRVRQGVKLWIDALCINQNDPAECGQQVARMRDIYASAWQVVIWLGAKSDDSDLAITALRWMATKSKEPHHLDDIYQKTIKIDARPLFVIRSRYRSRLRDSVYRALFHLLTRSYWQRMWILQEIAIAREDAPVVCGDMCLSWREVYDAAALIDSDDARLGLGIIDSVRHRVPRGWSFELGRDRLLVGREWSAERTWKLLMEMMTMQRDQKGISAAENPEHTVRRPLLLGRDAAVTKEMDRVYGILCIKAIRDKVNIEPNYLLPLSDIYRNFAAEMIARGDLNILRLSSPPQGHLEVADTWSIPDLPRSLNNRFITPYSGLFTTKSPKPLSIGMSCTHELPTWAVCWTCKQAPVAQLRGLYRAAGNMPLSFPIILPDHSLVTKGIIFDTITSLGAFDADELDRSYPCSKSKSLKPLSNTSSDLEATRTALWQTLVGNTTKDGGTNAPDTYSWILQPNIWLQRIAGVFTNGFGFSEIMQRNKSLVLASYTLEQLIIGRESASTWWNRVKTPQIYDVSEEQREAMSWALNVMAWRRLTGTENGRIGLAPAAAMLDDKVAVLPGCSMPLVLRQCRDGWTVVGECYLHGAMDGEVVRNKMELDDIKLY